MSPAPDLPIRFGAFELDLRTGELRKAGIRVSLPEQPFQVLKALIERPGDLVTREELRQRLWPAETFVDFEHGLNAAVRRLRDALGDSADVPRFVETLPRRGYRFIAPVTGPGPAQADAAAPTNPEISARSVEPEAVPPTPRRRAFAVRAIGLVSSLTLVAVSTLWMSGLLRWPLSTSPLDASEGPFVLAVPPFENLNRHSDQDYLGVGMSDELSVRLGRLEPARLSVVARDSAVRLRLKDSGERAKLEAKLGVSHELTGTIQTSGNAIRIIARLIDSRSERQLWAETYDAETRTPLKFQSEVADAITRAIASRLGVVRPAAGDSVTYSKNEQANVDYFRGRAHLAKDDQENLKKAEEHFLEAIRLDKSFANAHSGLADVYILMGADGFRSMDDAYRRARESATTALRIDPTLPDAHTSLAAVAGDYDWNWDDAERHLLSALQADPNHEPAARLYSFYLACLDRRDEALRFARQAVKLNPASPGALMNLAVIQYLIRDYDQALKTITETLDLEPEFGRAYVLMGRIYTAQGFHERAVEKLQHAHRLLGDRPDVIAPLAYGLARANRRREALDAAEELHRMAKPGMPSPFRVAMVDIGLGNTNQAIAGLQQALVAHDWQVTLLKVEPAFDSLRSDKRFGDLLERVGLSPR